MLSRSLKPNVNEYIDTFEKKFKNFCSKSPLLLEFVIAGDKVVVVDKSQKEDFRFEYNLHFDEDVKIAIKHIKDMLFDRYPYIFKTEMTYYSTEEISKMVKNGEGTIEEISDKIKSLIETRVFQIVKIIDQFNELVIRDLDTGELKLYRAKIPVQVFMKRVYEDSKENVYGLFINKTEFKKVLIERDS